MFNWVLNTSLRYVWNVRNVSEIKRQHFTGICGFRSCQNLPNCFPFLYVKLRKKFSDVNVNELNVLQICMGKYKHEFDENRSANIEQGFVMSNAKR